MRLTVYTDYMLRVSIYLALKHKSNELATIDHIAAAYDISRNHLMKIVHQMGQHGLVETLRGRSGGIRLARPPEHITVGEIVRLGEEDFAMVECQTQGQEQNCAAWQACNLKRSFRTAVDAFMSELDRVTLADTVTAPSGVQSVLGVNSEGKRIIAIASKPSRSLIQS